MKNPGHQLRRSTCGSEPARDGRQR